MTFNSATSSGLRIGIQAGITPGLKVSAISGPICLSGGYGVSLLNDCKYGYDIKDNVMRLTLIKSALIPDRTTDQGRHEFTYSLLPHEEDWVQGSTVREAWCLNNPLNSTDGQPVQKSFSLLSLSLGHVMVDALKKAEDEDAVIVRLHEFSGSRGKVILDLGLTVDSWQECDLLERPEGDRHTAGPISFEIKPYEIKSLYPAKSIIASS